MNAAVCRDNAADLSRLEAECRILKGFLHLSLSEEAEVAALLAAGALGVLGGDIHEELGIGLELRLEGLDVGDGFLLRPGDLLVAEGVHGPSGFPVLLQDVSAPDLHSNLIKISYTFNLP
jgi:hypothetical protein